MADFVELHPGMRVMVPPPEESLSGFYNSTVRGVSTRGMTLDIPDLDGVELELKPGERLSLFALVHGRLYEFETRVLDVDLMIRVAEPSEARRAERREFFRLLFSVPCKLVVFPDNEAERYTIEATIVDLSGGGTRVRSPEQFEPGTEIELRFPLDDQRLRLTAEVVRCSEISIGSKTSVYEVHCRFVELEHAEQEQIVRFVFAKQRQFNRRGAA